MDFAALRISAMAPRVVPLLRIIISAIGAEPDMRHYLARVEGGAIGTKRQFVAPQQSGRFRSKADMRRCHGRIARGTHDPGCAVAPSGGPSEHRGLQEAVIMVVVAIEADRTTSHEHG